LANVDYDFTCKNVSNKINVLYTVHIIFGVLQNLCVPTNLYNVEISTYLKSSVGYQ